MFLQGSEFLCLGGYLGPPRQVPSGVCVPRGMRLQGMSTPHYTHRCCKLVVVDKSKDKWLKY
jgi:hypothetical protein